MDVGRMCGKDNFQPLQGRDFIIIRPPGFCTPGMIGLGSTLKGLNSIPARGESHPPSHCPSHMTGVAPIPGWVRGVGAGRPQGLAKPSDPIEL